MSDATNKSTVDHGCGCFLLIAVVFLYMVVADLSERVRKLSNAPPAAERKEATP